MAKVRVEFVMLGISPGSDNNSANVLKALVGTPATLSVSATATVAASRPVAPSLPASPDPTRAGYGRLYARISAVEGDTIVAWAADPTAAQDNGVLVLQGAVEAVPVAPGEKLSFVELA